MIQRLMTLAAFVFLGAQAMAQGNASQPTQATAATLIGHLFCSNAGASLNSTTTVVYSGMFMGTNYFNVTTVSNVSLPTTQQAAYLRTYTDASGITFELRTVLTNQLVRLHLTRGTAQGALVLSPYATVPMTCTSNILKI